MKKTSFENTIFVLISIFIAIFVIGAINIIIKDSENVTLSKELRSKIEPQIEEFNKETNYKFYKLDLYKEGSTFQAVQFIGADRYTMNVYESLLNSEEESDWDQWDIVIGDLKDYNESISERLETERKCTISSKLIDPDTTEELLWVDEYGVVRYSIFNEEDLGGIDYIDID